MIHIQVCDAKMCMTSYLTIIQGKDATIRFRTEEQLMKLWKLLDSGADSRIQDEVILAYNFKAISVIKACLLLHI